MNSSKKAGGDKTVEVKMAPNTRVKKCQGYGGLKLDEERERMCGNDRKLQGGGNRKGGREGRKM